MNRGVMLKAACEVWPVTLLCGGLLLVLEAILSYVLPAYVDQFSDQIGRIEFVRKIIQGMLGTELAGHFGPEMVSAIPWVHPAVLAVSWAHAIVCCTRLPAGEIDRGTIDVLLGQPLSRWQIYCSESVVWLIAAAVLSAMILAGSIIGGLGLSENIRPLTVRRLMAIANLLGVYFAVGGFAWLVSAAANRRSTAITITFVVVLLSFLVNYLIPFWGVAEKLGPLSILTYYRPVFIVRDGLFPWGDVSILLALAGGFWIAAGIVFARRDLCTV